MIDSKVVEYIRSEIAKGISRDEISKNLIQGGGWTLADIEAHFVHIDQNQNNVPIKSTSSIQSNTEQIQPENKLNIFGLNFIIFGVYYILGIFLTGTIFGALVFYGYIFHAIILILISIMELIRGMSQKIKTNAGQYFLMAILLLIVGFGACTFAFANLAGGL